MNTLVCQALAHGLIPFLNNQLLGFNPFSSVRSEFWSALHMLSYSSCAVFDGNVRPSWITFQACPEKGFWDLWRVFGVGIASLVFDGGGCCPSCEACWKMLFLPFQVTVFFNRLWALGISFERKYQWISVLGSKLEWSFFHQHLLVIQLGLLSSYYPASPVRCWA